jgi:hypothetical protein
VYPRLLNENQEYLQTFPESYDKLERLITSLRSGIEVNLTDIQSDDPDSHNWNEILHSIPDAERNWLESPWIIAEFYFYRRLVDVFSFWSTSYDFFGQQKLNGLLTSYSHFEEMAAVWSLNDQTNANRESLQFGILTSLWGNKKDLSLWPESLPPPDSISSAPAANVEDKRNLLVSVTNLLQNTSSKVLDNHLEPVVEYLLSSSSSPSTIGIILDNAGYELYSDLLMGHIFLSCNIAQQIVFYTKRHPTFVSDATTCDCQETISHLTLNGYQHTQSLAKQWNEHIENKRFIFENDSFWCQPTGFRHLPSHLKEQVERHKILFIKVVRLCQLDDIFRVMQTTEEFWMIDFGPQKPLSKLCLVIGQLQFVHFEP